MDNTGYEWRYILNLGNAMLGVPMLAMPYCFEKCGWLLGILLIVASAYLSIKSSLLLWKISLITQPGSYEMAAEAIYGIAGKTLICICIIAFNFGITVASFVIIGDYMSQPAQYLLTLDEPFREIMIIFVGVLIILPLSLIRKIDKFYFASIASIVAYGMLILYLTLNSIYKITPAIMIDNIKIWDTWGALECIPIILSGFSCQTQMLILYETIPDTRKSSEDVKPLLDKAIYSVCAIYCTVGLFGYLNLSQSEKIQSDLLNNLNETPNISCQLLTFAFCCSLIVSLPMIVFPFRSCVYSLISARTSLTNVQFIPENHFVIITIVIVISSMVLGIVTPDISVILTLSGGYFGTLICFVFPALLFLKRCTPQEDITGAKLVLIFGIISMLTSSIVLMHKAYDTPYKDKQMELGETLEKWVDYPGIDAFNQFDNNNNNNNNNNDLINNLAQKQILLDNLDSKDGKNDKQLNVLIDNLNNNPDIQHVGVKLKKDENDVKENVVPPGDRMRDELELGVLEDKAEEKKLKDSNKIKKNKDKKVQNERSDINMNPDHDINNSDVENIIGKDLYEKHLKKNQTKSKKEFKEKIKELDIGDDKANNKHRNEP